MVKAAHAEEADVIHGLREQIVQLAATIQMPHVKTYGK